jgi:hypothetical protein
MWPATEAVWQGCQSGKVVGFHCQDEAGPRALDAAIDGLGHAADGFCPAEGEEDQTTIRGIVFPTQVDPLSVLDLEGIALASGRAGVDR